MTATKGNGTKIVQVAQIEGRYTNIVMALFEDGSLEDIVQYYNEDFSVPDEDFIGLTYAEVFAIVVPKIPEKTR